MAVRPAAVGGALLVVDPIGIEAFEHRHGYSLHFLSVFLAAGSEGYVSNTVNKNEGLQDSSTTLGSLLGNKSYPGLEGGRGG